MFVGEQKEIKSIFLPSDDRSDKTNHTRSKQYIRVKSCEEF
jgi:hypothetical protein